MTDENMKELLFYRKAMKILADADANRTVWYYQRRDNAVYSMKGNTVMLLLQDGIYRFYDTCEEAEKAEMR